MSHCLLFVPLINILNDTSPSTEFHFACAMTAGNWRSYYLIAFVYDLMSMHKGDIDLQIIGDV